MFGSLINAGHSTPVLNAPIAKAEEYSLTEINGCKYIIGTKKTQRSPIKSIGFSYSTVNRVMLLRVLIDAYERLDAIDPYKANELSDESIERILNLTRSYGFLVEPLEIEQDPDYPSKYYIGRVNENGEFIPRRNHKLTLGTSVTTIYNRLRHLYIVYDLWHKVYGEHEKLSKTEIGTFQLFTLTDFKLEYVLDFFDDENELVSTPGMKALCPDIISIAFAQICFEYMACSTGSGASVGLCSVCGKAFFKSRANNTQCPECQKTKVKRWKAQQKLKEND